MKRDSSFTVSLVLACTHKWYTLHSSLATDDIQLVQYMVKSDGNLKLGDFNRGEFPLYDEERGEYCK